MSIVTHSNTVFYYNPLKNIFGEGSLLSDTVYIIFCYAVTLALNSKQTTNPETFTEVDRSSRCNSKSRGT